MSDTETIAAIATPAGRGGVGIVRISGPLAGSIAAGIAGELPSARQAVLRHFRNKAGEAIDTGLLLWFPAPGSYTGEDVAELQGHGGPVVMNLLLQASVDAGARIAEPGEFSQRAFLNDRIDLTQAEAVADLIDAGSRQAAQAALASLDGEFSSRVHNLVDSVTGIRTWIEAAIDFSDEDIDFLGDETLQEMLDAATVAMSRLLADAGRGRALRDGLRVVILGKPNVGKSSLLNALAATDAAIVTDTPGTTRDLLNEQIDLDGLRLHVTDTAGLRDSPDAIEQEGVRRARAAAGRAELLLLVVDDREGMTRIERELLVSQPDLPLLTVYNKCDLSGGSTGSRETESGPALGLSVKTGAGMPALHSALKEQAGLREGEASPLLARQRHLDALHLAETHLSGARHQLADGAGELAAEELRLCQQALSRITGEFSSEDLLGEIFSSFCVGK